MALYSDKVMDHFMNPRNVGEIENADGIGEVGNPVCGDMMTFYIKVENGRIVDVKFKTFGCGAAIAVSSMVSEMAKGKTLEEALEITNDAVAEELGGLPKNKLHCSNLGADALHAAIRDYMKKHNMELPEGLEEVGQEDEHIHVHTGPEPEVETPIEEKTESISSTIHYCPYCESPLPAGEGGPLLCNHCHISFIHCPSCGKLVSETLSTCPHCNTALSA